MSKLSNQQIQQEAASILQDEAFQEYTASRRSDEWLFDMLDKLFSGLNKVFHFRLPFEDAGSLFQGVAVLLKTLFFFSILLLILYFFMWLIDWATRSVAATVAENGTISLADRRKARQSYQDLANQALANGEYGRAIHYLFLAAVSLVIKGKAFHVSEVMTNREIAASTDLSTYRQGQDMARAFYAMLSIDEPRWFGNLTATKEDYDRFIDHYRLFDQLIQREAHE